MTGARLDLADYYHWEEPGRGVNLYLRSTMVDRLQNEVARAGANEIGGILIGRPAGQGGDLVIEDFVPVARSNSDGLLYNLSDNDTLTLEAALLRAAFATGSSILGYFRSHQRDGLSLSPADLSLINSYFQDPASVFLLVKPLHGSKTCTAGFFFWEDGRVQPEFSALEVALGGPPVTEPAPEPAPEAVTQPSPQPAPALVTPAPPADHFWRDLFLRAAIVTFAAITVVFAVLTYLGTRTNRLPATSPAPTPALLGMQLRRTPVGVSLTWNPKAPEISAADRASLFIRDGIRHKVVELDKTQLVTGSVLYTPAGDDVQFRLEVYTPEGQSASQSVRLLLPQPAPQTKPSPLSH